MDPSNPQLNSRILVRDYYNELPQVRKLVTLPDPDRTGMGHELSEVPATIGLDEVYIVWYGYILGDWKCVLSTAVPDDRYYEVTFNSAKGETYLDVYVKNENQVFQNHGLDGIDG